MALPRLRKAKVYGATPGSALPAGGVCDHCGDSMAGLKAVERRLEGRPQRYCCQGCAFIAEQLVLARQGVELPIDATSPPDGAAPRAASRAAQLAIDGMSCAACGLLIEHRLGRLPGIERVRVDFATGRAALEFADGPDAAATPARAAAEIRRLGYRVDADRATLHRARRVALLRVLWAWLAMMQVMMLAAPSYLADPGQVAAGIQQLLRIAQCVLTFPVILFSAGPLWRAAASQLRVGSIGMDLPVVLGLGAASIASVVATLRSTGAVYFDSITMFVALVLAVRQWQAWALAKAAAHVAAAAGASDPRAQRLVDYPDSAATETLPAARLQVGDHIVVAPGATVPADGRVVEGASCVSMAWLSGESSPVAQQAGDIVLAGSINLEQPLVVQVRRVGDATSLAALRRLTQMAGHDRPAAVEAANRFAAVFLWLILGLTVATVAGWLLVDPARALPSAIAVLVATCPCALSLAAPAALLAAQAALARRGVLVSRLAALEALATVDAVVCDKTGTLTEGEPVLARLVALRPLPERELLALAATLEAGATHPFAHAILAAARAAAVVPRAASQRRVAPAAGIEACIEGRRYRIGTPAFALALSGDGASARAPHAAMDQLSEVVLADEDGVLALFGCAERLRPGAQALAAQWQASGRELWVLSGDQPAAVERIGGALGLDRAHLLAQRSPAGKVEWVTGLQRARRRVAVIGDGLNDAPVIALADVSIALASGADLAQARADLIVLRSSLDDVGFAFDLARRTARTLRVNLAWALGYNLLMVPLAALGLVTPALAAAGMALSSLLVVAHALRLQRGGRAAAAT